MALPKISYPTFTTTIPSSGELITFRPYNNGEEKILLTAGESGEIVDIINATKQVIKNCYENIDTSKLKSYDIDFLFLQLRIKSVSPYSELSYRNMECEKEGGNPCKRAVNIRINLEDIKVQKYNPESESYELYSPKKGEKHQIKLSDTVGVFMQHPGFIEQEALSELGNSVEEEDLIKICISSIYDSESVYTRDDFTEEELNTWYDELPTDSKKQFKDFISNIPLLRYETTFACKECGFSEKIVLEDLASFFG